MKARMIRVFAASIAAAITITVAAPVLANDWDYETCEEEQGVDPRRAEAIEVLLTRHYCHPSVTFNPDDINDVIAKLEAARNEYNTVEQDIADMDELERSWYDWQLNVYEEEIYYLEILLETM